MLQNINILVGELPVETGNLKEDYRELRAFQERLMRGLERNFDLIDAALSKGASEETAASIRSTQ